MEDKPNRQSSLVRPDISGDFVLLDGSCAVSPEAKISVRLGRFDLEANGVQTVDVHYDPLIRADRLLMPEDQSPYYIEPTVAADQPRMIPFFSNQATPLDSFIFHPGSLGSARIFAAAQLSREDADGRAQHYSKKLGDNLSRGPFELLQRVIGAIGLLTAWPTEILRGSWDRIEIRMAAAFLQRVTEETGQLFDHECATENLISIVERLD